MIHCKNGHNYKDNLFSVCAECLSWNVSLYLKTLIHTPCFFFKSAKSGHLWHFRAMFLDDSNIKCFTEYSRCPLSIMLQAFCTFDPQTLWYESRDNIFNWIPFHMSISENFVINGYLSNIVGVTFNRISSWFHNI